VGSSLESILKQRERSGPHETDIALNEGYYEGRDEKDAGDIGARTMELAEEKNQRGKKDLRRGALNHSEGMRESGGKIRGTQSHFTKGGQLLHNSKKKLWRRMGIAIQTTSEGEGGAGIGIEKGGVGSGGKGKSF